MADLSPRGERLRRELVRQRDLAGLSARRLATEMGSNYGKVWRVESGKQLPTIPLVRQWLESCNADALDRGRITDLVEAVHGETRGWGDLLTGVAHLQGVARERESGAAMVRNFQPTVVPGLLQTPEYAARIIPLADHMGAIDHAAALATRLERQQRLYEDGHQFQFLLVESALRWSVQLGAVTPAQVDRIGSLAKLPNVDIAVIPAGEDVVVPWHNFAIWEPQDDEPMVTIEQFHGEQTITDVEVVEMYRRLWVKAWDSAEAFDRATVEYS